MGRRAISGQATFARAVRAFLDAPANLHMLVLCTTSHSMRPEEDAFTSLAAGLHFDRSKQPRKLFKQETPLTGGLDDTDRNASHDQAGPSDRQESHSRDPFEVLGSCKKHS